ncbi:MAG: hypothetical protein AAFY31_03405, partial [Pseudomonadota bacterium]
TVFSLPCRPVSTRPARVSFLTVEATETGRQACTRYREIREQLLLDAVLDRGLEAETVSQVAALLRMMSGQYDQAARAATVL